MSSRVREIMNRELFRVRPGDVSSDVLNGILALGITGAPVVDDRGRPLGMVTLRDLVGRTGTRAGGLMTSPAVTISADAPIAEAGRRIAETGRHPLVAVDGEERAIGVVSAVDVIRGLLGLPIKHPASFPHFDEETRLTWTDDAPLDLEHLDGAPDGPGLLQLVHGGVGLPERVVWVEACENVYARLTDMLDTPQRDQAVLAWWLGQSGMRFRAAAAADPAERRKALEVLRARARRIHVGVGA
jgi:CBS domain-containing protein